MKILYSLKHFVMATVIGFLGLIPVYQAEHSMQVESGSFEQSSIKQVVKPYKNDSVSDDELMQILTDQPSDDDSSKTSDYSITVEEYEKIEKQIEDQIEGRLNSTTLVSSAEPMIDYANPKTCSAKSLIIEKILKNENVLNDLKSERSPEEESPLLPRHCVTHVMNSFDMGPESFARCPWGAKSEPMSGAGKPCVTKNLVNVTYNSFVDIAECLNINPKNLLPKLANESGFMINTLGAGSDAGVGQLTRIAIVEVNKYYKKYLNEMNKAAISKPACLRVVKNKALLAKVNENISQRCSLIVPPENPIKNFLYMAILTRRNMDSISGVKYVAGNDYVEDNGSLIAVKKNHEDQLTGRFKEAKIREKLEQLGLTDINLHEFVEMISMVAYNAGIRTSFNIFNDYLNQRIKAKLPLTWKDFDFHNPETAVDPYTKEEKTVTAIARSYIKSPLIIPNDTLDEKKIKLKRVRELSEKIKNSYKLTFPEYITYNQNNFFDSRINPENIAKIKAAADKAAERSKYPNYEFIGAPGYLNFLAAKDKALREVFGQSSYGPDYCSNPNFLMREKNQ